MYLRSPTAALRHQSRRAAVAAAAVANKVMVTRSSTGTGDAYGSAGHVMFAMNQLSLGWNNPRLRLVKDCIDQVSPATLYIGQVAL
jgi:hypothetical protein